MHQEVDAANIDIVRVEEDHFAAITNIYSEGIATGIATFEVDVPSWEQWNEKFLADCSFVLLANNTVAGWAAVSQVSKREVYKGVAESTIYIGRDFQKKGFGRTLLSHLISESEKSGYWTLQASIFAQNIPSIKLHKNCGFRLVGRRERIAMRDGIWHDNILLEKRTNS